MAKTNLKESPVSIQTHGGAIASKESPEKELTRTVSAMLLFEDSFYESGSDIALNGVWLTN